MNSTPCPISTRATFSRSLAPTCHSVCPCGLFRSDVAATAVLPASRWRWRHPYCRSPTAECPLLARVDMKPLSHNLRRPRAILDRLESSKDSLGIRLSDGERSHVKIISSRSAHLNGSRAHGPSGLWNRWPAPTNCRWSLVLFPKLVVAGEWPGVICGQRQMHAKPIRQITACRSGSTLVTPLVAQRGTSMGWGLHDSPLMQS
jgi:hypothetical protein